MKKTNSFLLLVIGFLLGFNSSLSAQQEVKYTVASIGFYNVENLFDTILNPELSNNAEFTPSGPNRWTSKRYNEKLANMAFVISQIATDVTPDGLAILGVSEIENRGVLEDLIKEETLKSRNYQIVHYDSPDYRGVDVGLIYQPKYFKVTNSRSHTLKMEDTTFKTRDQLVVSGLLNGEMIHVIVNHWPSRRGGEKASAPKRNAAADLTRSIVDSLLAIDNNAKILVMGDLNDDPVNKSVKDHLRAKGNQDQLKPGDMFNPMYKLYKDGIGSLAYQDAWNLFDQIIISQGLLGPDKSSWKFHNAKVFSKNFMKQKDGAYAGYPLRTFAGGVYMNGYSDHFPVYVNLVKTIE